MEVFGTDIKQKLSNKYCCEKCNYVTDRKSNIDNHFLSVKHQKHAIGNEIKQNLSNIKQQIKNTFCCEKCNKKYQTQAGLWKHNQKCIVLNNEHNLSENNETNSNNNQEIKELKELMKYLMKENSELKSMVFEVIKNGTHNINTTTTTTTNSHNKSFNLQFFLNETCKDAMNLSDFINSMKLQLSDLESVGKLGFVDGISNIIINNLKALDIEKRPVHCSDSKRETMYIKNQDKWEKDDDELNQIKQMIRQVRDKNISLITSWRDLYPECLLSNSKKTDQYNQICSESFGFKKEREEKIISKIAKSVFIDKK
jgi:hypothetical protein